MITNTVVPLRALLQVLGFSGRMEKQMENKMESERDTRLV